MLNTFKTLVTDPDILEKDDLWILDKIKDFVSNPEAATNPAANQLVILTDHVSMVFFFLLNDCQLI